MVCILDLESSFILYSFVQKKKNSQKYKIAYKYFAIRLDAFFIPKW